MAPGVIFAAPLTAPSTPLDGAHPISSVTSWVFGSWVDVLPTGWANPVVIIGFAYEQTDGLNSLDVTEEGLFEIGVGAGPTTIIQIPHSHRQDTLVGYYLPRMFKVMFPEPVEVAASTRVAVRTAYLSGRAITYDGVKVLFAEIEIAAPTRVPRAPVVNFQDPGWA